MNPAGSPVHPGARRPLRTHRAQRAPLRLRRLRHDTRRGRRLRLPLAGQRRRRRRRDRAPRRRRLRAGGPSLLESGLGGATAWHGARPPRTDPPPGAGLLHALTRSAPAAQISMRGCGAAVDACQCLRFRDSGESRRARPRATRAGRARCAQPAEPAGGGRGGCPRARAGVR